MKNLRMIAPVFALLIAVLARGATPPSAPAAEPVAAPATPDGAIHDELRKVRAGILEAINHGDIDKQLDYMHPDIVVTWHNAEVSRGKAGVREYLERMTKGSAKVVTGYRADLESDALSVIYGGDTAIAYGSTTEEFDMVGGLKFHMKGRWSATLVKSDGRWLVASIHVSQNIFDNPLLNQARQRTYWFLALGVLLGGIGGWLIGRRRRKA